MKILRTFTSAWLCSGLLSATALALDLGDRAPSLRSVTNWLNGTPVDPAAPDGCTRYVVELWATWCGPCRASAPHLAKLHERYKDRGVVIVGLTTEPEEKVRPFVESLKIPYRIALDPNETTSNTWWKGVEGIPHAFLVETNGTIVWAGHPMDGLEATLEDVVQGRWNRERVQQREQIQAKLTRALERGQFAEALQALDELLRDQPKRLELHQLRLGLLAQLGDRAALRAHHHTMLDAFRDSPKELNEIAWSLAAPSPLPVELRDPEIALRAALRAAELTDHNDANILDTLAMAYHSVGLTEMAIITAERALRLCNEAEDRSEIETNLNFFRTAIQARAVLKETNAPAPTAAPTP